MVWKWVGCCRVKRWPSVATWEGRGARHGWWLVSDRSRHATPPRPSRHPARVHRQCWIIQCELLAFVLFLELFVLIGNQPIIGRLFGTDYRPTNNRPVHYRCIPNIYRIYNLLDVSGTAIPTDICYWSKIKRQQRPGTWPHCCWVTGHIKALDGWVKKWSFSTWRNGPMMKRWTVTNAVASRGSEFHSTRHWHTDRQVQSG